MRSDYKISQILELPDKTVVTARFFEGDYQDVPDIDTGEIKRRYVRVKVLRTEVIELPAKTSLAAINGYLKRELQKDKKRSPIEDQNA